MSSKKRTAVVSTSEVPGTAATAAAPASKKVKKAAPVAVVEEPEEAVEMEDVGDAEEEATPVSRPIIKSRVVKTVPRDSDDTIELVALKDQFKGMGFTKAPGDKKGVYNVYTPGKGEYTGQMVSGFLFQALNKVIYNGLKYWPPNKARNIPNESIRAQYNINDEEYQALELYMDQVLRFVHKNAVEILGDETGSALAAQPYEIAKLTLNIMAGRGWTNGKGKDGKQYSKQMNLKVGRHKNGYPLINIYNLAAECIYNMPRDLNDDQKLVEKDVLDYNDVYSRHMRAYPSRAHITTALGSGTATHINAHLAYGTTGFRLVSGKISVTFTLYDIYKAPLLYKKKDITVIPSARKFVPSMTPEMKAQVEAQQAAAKAQAEARADALARAEAADASVEGGAEDVGEAVDDQGEDVGEAVDVEDGEEAVEGDDADEAVEEVDVDDE